MTTEEKVEAIRQACIKANPEIDTTYWISPKDPYEGIEDCKEVTRPIRLADVLLAKECINRAREMYNRYTYETVEKWNLHADDLTQQSPETIDFLYGLLAPQL